MSQSTKREPEAGRSARRLRLACSTALGIAWAVMLAAGAVAQTPPGSETSIQPQAWKQMSVLMTEKATRTPTQRKIASSLLLEIKRQTDVVLREALPKLRTRVEIAADGRVLLDLDAEVDDALLRRIEALGGEVVSAFPQFEAVRARLPLGEIENLAASEQVRTLRPADRHAVRMTNVTEGDVAHGADLARTNLGVDGTGVQVGAMSDSVDALASVQASGDLPGTVTVLAGQSGNPGTSEGTALLEIIHDMAPGADLFFATGAGGQAQFAQNILDLQAAGCDVIADDIFYFSEPVFQDGVIAQAVDTVAAAGTLFFSAAGNAGNLDAGTAGVWEGDYVATTLPPPLAAEGVSAHDFGGGSASNQLTFDPPFFITLQWTDPQDASTNDFDLYLLDSTLTNVVDSSTNDQTGTQDPFEIIDSQVDDDLNNRVVVVLDSGVGRFLHLNTHRGMLDVATDGQIFGHPAALGAIAVAAVNVSTAGGGEFTGGPANPSETFTSDGPRRIFFNPDGTPVALAAQPAGLRHSGVMLETKDGTTCEVRQKPDVAAADGVSTATPGFNPFFGTSASAPHSAAIGVLFKEAFPSVPVGDAYDAFRTSALDIDALGVDRNSGFGIQMAEPSLDTIFADGFESGNTSAWTSEVP